MSETLFDSALFDSKVEMAMILRDKFIEPPFSVLNTKSGNWQKRKRQWRELGIVSEVGRKDDITFNIDFDYGKEKVGKKQRVSIFDPALCEVLYKWFCVDGGSILDPFAGGSVRGIVANYLGYKYTGIDISSEQIKSNIKQGLKILCKDNQPNWIVGDANKVLNDVAKHNGIGGRVKFDFVFSCPPYANLEVYSDLEGDISNKKYPEFLKIYEEIIKKSCEKLKPGGYACFVVGEIRDKKGNYIGFVPDTIRAFEKAGMKYYNEMILLNAIGSASIRANGNMKNRKIVKVHQNVLVFKK